jgi:hypothetical protein
MVHIAEAGRTSRYDPDRFRPGSSRSTDHDPTFAATGGHSHGEGFKIPTQPPTPEEQPDVASPEEGPLKAGIGKIVVYRHIEGDLLMAAYISAWERTAEELPAEVKAVLPIGIDIKPLEPSSKAIKRTLASCLSGSHEGEVVPLLNGKSHAEIIAIVDPLEKTE